MLMATVLVQVTFAQAPITANNLNIIGDVTTIAICGNDMVDPGPSGADQAWDMSGLTETEEQGFMFVNPENTYWGYEFPASTICGVSWTGEHSYYRFDSEGVTVEGYAGTIPDPQPTDTFKIIYDDPENFIPVPFDYGDTHQDDNSGTSYAAGLEIPFTGDVDFEADGYGTLILPTGTYENVVRYRFFRTQLGDTGFGIITQTKEQWGWMSPDHRFWLMIQEINDDGFSESELIWYDKDPLPALVTSVQDIDNMSLEFFPNPAIDGQEVNLKWDRNEIAEVSVTAISGKQILNEQVTLQNGLNPLNLSGITTYEGLYVVQVMTERGVTTSKLVLRK